MPSVELGQDRERGVWAWLRSQGLGVFCGLATCVLMGVGSFVLAFAGDGGDPFVRMDDVRAFFEHPSLANAWFYALCAVLALYALNTLLATIDTVVRRVRAGVRTFGAYAATMLHLAFLAALLAHGLDGLFHVERGRVVLGPSFTQLPDGPEARVLSVVSERLPSGMPKRVQATLELRDAGGALSQAVVGYNEPLSFGAGREVWLYQGQGRTEAARTLVRGQARCAVEAHRACVFGPFSVELVSTMGAARPGAPVIARLRVRTRDAAAQAAPKPQVGMVAAPEKGDVLLDRWIAAGRALPLPDGTGVELREDGGAPVVALEGRHKPGHPFALASALLLCVGLGMMIRRFGPRG